MDISDFISRQVFSVADAEEKAAQAFNLVRDAKNRGDIELSEYYPLAGEIDDQLDRDREIDFASATYNRPSVTDLIDEVAGTPKNTGRDDSKEALESSGVTDLIGEAIALRDEQLDPTNSVILGRSGAPDRSLTDRGESVAVAGGTGAVIGAGLPSVLTGLGQGLGKLQVPGAKIAGAGLNVAGKYLGKMPPLLRVVDGGVASAGGEAVGQVVTDATNSPTYGFAADLAFGAGFGVFASALEFTWGVTGRLFRSLNSVAQSQNASKKIRDTTNTLSLGGDDYNSAQIVTDALATGGKKITQAGERAAIKLQQSKQAQITVLEDDVISLGVQIKNSAIKGEELYKSVGTPLNLSDTGGRIRSVIQPNYVAAIQARSSQYTKDLVTRNSVVAKKEANGDYVTNQPVYKKLMKEIENKLLMGVKALNTPTKQVADPGVVNAYKSIYSALNDKIVPISEAQYKRLAKKGLKVEERNSPDGPVYFRIFPNSFEALDDVRRKLGDAAFNKSEEGYGALGQNIAKDLYSKVSAIQLKYAGESHRILQGNYEEASSLLVPFKAMRGNKVTAVDKIDPSQFKDDVAGLPAKFFSTRQGALDLIELTGDKVVSEDLAASYVANTIKNMDGKQLNAYLANKQTSDWVRVFPKLKTNLDALLVNTRKNESLIDGWTKKVARLETDQSKLATEGASEGAKLVNEAHKFASEVTGDSFRPDARIAKLLSSTSDPKVISAVTEVITSSPQAKAAFPNAVRQYIARNANKSVKSLWMGNLKPMLKASGMVDDASLDAIERDVLNVQSAFNEAETGVHLLNKVIFTTLTTGLATAPTRQKEAKTYFTDRGKPASLFSL